MNESGGGIVYQDEAGLVAALDRMAGDAAFRTECGEAGHRYFLRHFTKDAHFRDYCGLIGEVAARKGIQL